MVPNRLGQRRVAGLAGASLMAMLLTCGHLSALSAAPSEEPPTEIVHAPLECWPAQEHIVLSADVQPSGDVKKMLAYFRWDRHAAWYFVPMQLNAQGMWVGVMPKTQPGTTGAVYFFESLSTSFVSTRSDEIRVPVRPASQCENAPALIYTGSSPNITVGATRAGQPVPPGFDPSGVRAYVNASGVTTSAGSGGGVSGRTLAVIGGAGGAAALLTLGSNEESATTSTDGIAGITSTAGPTTTVIAAGPTSPSSTSTSTPRSSTSSATGGNPPGPQSTTSLPTTSPTTGPSTGPSTTPTTSPTTNPTTAPTTNPTTNPTTAPTTNPTTAPTTNPTTAPTQRVADIAVQITSAPSGANAGEFFRVTIRATNNGPDPANIETFLNVTGPSPILKGQGCGAQPPVLRCNLTIVSPGASETRHYDLRTDAGPVQFNLSYRTNIELDPVSGNNTDSATVAIN